MTIHTCIRCGFNTIRLASLKKHYQRKNPCKDELECGKEPSQLLSELTPKKEEPKEEPKEAPKEESKEAIHFDVPYEVGIIMKDLKIYCLIKNTATQDTKNLIINMNITVFNHGKEIVDNAELRKLFIKDIFETCGLPVEHDM
jgi:hypothetical protein